MSNDKSNSEQEDIELMLRVKNGDHTAFEQLVKKHQHGVVSTVSKMLGSASDAEDVAQEVFVRVFKAAGSYTPTAKFSTWLFTIVKNVTFNEIRRRQSRIKPNIPLVTEHKEQESEIEKRPDSTGTPTELILQHELEKAVERALASLPEQQRLALILLRYEDMSYEQIAEIMKVSVGALKSIIFRGREALRAKLAKYL